MAIKGLKYPVQPLFFLLLPTVLVSNLYLIISKMFKGIRLTSTVLVSTGMILSVLLFVKCIDREGQNSRLGNTSTKQRLLQNNLQDQQPVPVAIKIFTTAIFIRPTI